MTRAGTGEREILVRVVAPYFVAGFVMLDGRVIATAPILRRHVSGASADDIRAAFASRGWRASIIARRDAGSA